MSVVLDDRFLDHALTVAREAASAAAEVIHRWYRAADVGLSMKPDDTPVTRADVESEQAIRTVLQQAFPEHAIYGEEQGRSGSGRFLWLVDPIDGTKSFVRGYPMFSTQIALMVDGEIVLGVSAAAEFGETMWARRGGGAFLNGDRVGVSTVSELKAATVSTGNLKTLAATPGWNVLAGLVRGAHRIRGYGDFYHYHLLARGAIDLVLESDVNILDIAPLVLILREAGAVFTDLDGVEPGLATTTVMAGTPAMHALARTRFAGWRGD